MGVPKFYRWVSERYPCLSQVVQEHQIPEFDNLYLDMNGIIHPCSHPNDDDPHFRITEEQIFRNIFHYIEVLFQIVKPKKVFFMAVDGVAPRAKMNQQRGRRFRSAKEAEDNIRRALEKGQILPKEERFDSNCITPGTEFMTRLHEQLKYFVTEKISNDPAWQGLQVYLSGHQTPGEGEHKIMEYIRTERSKPGYDPNTRHCLYGLDADLIMLGLSSHEPHFSLLREEVRFGKTSKRIEKPENITFHLLHLSLFREYLDWEFSSLKTSLSFPYDLERIIDDWILMGFLVGNDFIPHLPHLHINHNALPMLYKVYTEVMPTLDGYLHEGGGLCLNRFEKYLSALSKLDRDKFEEIFVDMKWFEAKTKHGFDKKPGRSKPKMNQEQGFASDNGFAALDSFSDQTGKAEEQLSPELAKLAAAMDNEEDEEGEDVFEIEFAMHKKQYYREKFEIEDINSGGLSRIVWEYVRGIQWILHYYFNGVQSWGWFYPYHYAPFLSDLKFFSDQILDYEMGKPFLPFEQLLAVLPAASKQLLPEPLQNLMIMEESPIIHFYPLHFKTDLNGKQQEWEAVVLIPFIDEKMLLDAITPLYPRLTKDEKKRNTHGPFHLYTFDGNLSYTYASSLPGVFPDIQLCHAKSEDFDRAALVTAPKDLLKGLCEDVKLDVYFPGFPTLHHIQHNGELKKANVKVFQMHSRWESMILQLKSQPDKATIRIAQDLLGEVCYVNWPHMVEAKVLSVSDNTFKYVLSADKPKTNDGQKNIEQEVMTDNGLAVWNKQVSSYIQFQLERRGIDVGEVHVIVEASPILGRRFLCSSKGQVTLEKEWSPVPKQYAVQSVAKDIFVHESVTKSNIQTIEQLFPVGSQCFMLGNPYYGAQGEVLEVDVSQGRVRVQLKVPKEPNITPVIMQRESLSEKYIPAHILAQKLGISNSLLGKMTAKFLIERGSREKSKGQGQAKLDIGLNLKHSKHNKELIGYTKRREEGWFFSPAAQKIVSDYISKFPRLFEVIGSLESKVDQFYENDLLEKDISEETLREVQTWKASLALAKQEPLSCGGDILDDPILEEIERTVQETKKTSQTKLVKVRVRPYLLFRPSDYLGNTLPDSDAEFQLFDRVINVKLNSAVPFGLRGTIVGFHTGEDGDEMIEVLYDESFVGHQPVRRTATSVYMVRASSFIDLSYGERREAKKRGQPVPPPRPLNKTFSAALAGRNGSPQRNGQGSPRNNRHGSPHVKDALLSKAGSPLANGKIRNSGQESGNPVVSVTRIATPPNRQLVTTAGSIDKKKGRSIERDLPPRFQKTKPDNAHPHQTSSSNTNEFANMWKELQMKENSPPSNETRTLPQADQSTVSSVHAVPQADQSTVSSVHAVPQADQSTVSSVHTVSSIEAEAEVKQNKVATQTTDKKDLEDNVRSKSPYSLAQEGTQALCQLLQIGHHLPTTSGQTSPSESKKEERTGVEARKEVMRSPSASGAPGISGTTGTPLTLEELFKSQGTPPLPQTPQPHIQVPGPNMKQGRLPSQDLMHYCLSLGLPPPNYYYTKGPMGLCAAVELANGLKFVGVQCGDRAEAAESASAIAMRNLNRIYPIHQPPPGAPMMMAGSPYSGLSFHHHHPVHQPFSQLGPEYGFPQTRPRHVNPAGQVIMPARSRMPGMPHGAHTGAGKSASDGQSMAFVPMQVTRRTVSSKAVTPTKPTAIDITEDDRSRDTPSKTGDPEPNHVPLPKSPQGVLIPPSSFSESKATKTQTTDLQLQDGALGANKGLSSSKSMNLPEAPHIKDQQIKEGNDVSKDIKHEDSSPRPKSGSTRKSKKRIMAPSFSNK